MNESGEIIWKGKAIGKAQIISQDMWYVAAIWAPNQSEEVEKFKQIASTLKSDDVIKNPTKGTIIELKYSENSSTSTKFLVLGLEGSELYMRMISDEIAEWVENNSDELKQPNRPWWKFW